MVGMQCFEQRRQHGSGQLGQVPLDVRAARQKKKASCQADLTAVSLGWHSQHRELSAASWADVGPPGASRAVCASSVQRQLRSI
jgi:hypothetical protein